MMDREELALIEGAWIFGHGGKMTKIEAQRGETPACPEARFQRGDIVKVMRNKSVGHFPAECAVVAVIPTGFSPDWAPADLFGKPRPLMCSVGVPEISYLLAADGDPTPYVVTDKNLLPSGKDRVQIIARICER